MWLDASRHLTYSDNKKIADSFPWTATHVCFVAVLLEIYDDTPEKRQFSHMIPRYGTKDIYDIFDESCFVYYDVKSPASALARIQSLQASDEDYTRAVSSSCLHEEGNRSSTVDNFFSLGHGLGAGSIRKSIRRMMGYDE